MYDFFVLNAKFLVGFFL